MRRDRVASCTTHDKAMTQPRFGGAFFLVPKRSATAVPRLGRGLFPVQCAMIAPVATLPEPTDFSTPPLSLHEMC
jgi:hypothetical protein